MRNTVIRRFALFIGFLVPHSMEFGESWEDDLVDV